MIVKYKPKPYLFILHISTLFDSQGDHLLVPLGINQLNKNSVSNLIDLSLHYKIFFFLNV